MSGAGWAIAPTASAAACTTPSGVTVVVDRGSLGGTTVGCAAHPASGLAALRATGHSVTYVPRQPGLVCTIDQLPHPCNGAPPKAYWSYWHASPGGSWSYGTTGAGSYRPASGSVDGWAFGAGRPPSSRPPARPTPATAAASSPAHPASTSRTAPTRPSRETEGTSGGTTAAQDTRTPERSAVPAASAPEPSTTTPSATDAAAPATPSGAGTTGGPRAPRTDAAVPTSATTDTGSTTGVIVTVVLVGLLAGGGGTIAWRRRRSGD